MAAEKSKKEDELKMAEEEGDVEKAVKLAQELEVLKQQDEDRREKLQARKSKSIPSCSTPNLILSLSFMLCSKSVGEDFTKEQGDE